MFQQKQNVLYRITRRIHQRQRFLTIHGFLLVNWIILSLYLYVFNDRNIYHQDSILFTLLWIGIFVIHYRYVQSKERQDEELLNVINNAGEKRKFHYEEEYVQQRPDMTEEYRMRLGDDGELVHSDLTEEEIAFYEQQERNQQRT